MGKVIEVKKYIEAVHRVSHRYLSNMKFTFQKTSIERKVLRSNCVILHVQCQDDHRDVYLSWAWDKARAISAVEPENTEAPRPGVGNCEVVPGWGPPARQARCHRRGICGTGAQYLWKHPK
jgi:hypothetical protein